MAAKTKAPGRLAARRQGDVAYAPAQTKLGAALRRIRRRIIEEGTPLLTSAQVRKEVAERRGGRP